MSNSRIIDLINIDKSVTNDTDIIIDLIFKKEFPVNFFSNYVYWNSIFAGCVTSLAAKFHLWPYVHSPNESELNTNDFVFFNAVNSLMKNKSHTIASYIFAAAEDEYNDQSSAILNKRISHKDMAWLFITQIYNIQNKDISTRKIDDFTIHLNKRVMLGYGVESSSSFENLSYNIGFHVASEKLAAYEFQKLYNHTKDYYPNTFKSLQEFTDINIGVTAISWLKIHGVIEEEHFNNATIAVNIIEEHMLNSGSKKGLNLFENNFINGFNDFKKVHESFFKYYIG